MSQYILAHELLNMLSDPKTLTESCVFDSGNKKKQSVIAKSKIRGLGREMNDGPPWLPDNCK